MILDEKMLRRLDTLALAMREYARGGAGGLRRSRALGASVEFSDFRGYAPGDDLRRVDWNAFARFDKLFLKLFLDEQEVTLRLLIDASASMDWGVPGKWALTLQVAAMLAYLSLMRYDRVVIVTLQGDMVRASQTFGGRAAYPRVEAHLEAIVPQGETMLDQALLRVPISAGRGLCVLLSDLLSEHGWTRGAASLLHRRQALSLLHILAAQEMEPDMTGAVQLLDREGGPTCDVHLSPDTLRRYQQTLDAFLAEQKAFCFARQIPYLLLRSDMPLERDVLRAMMAGGLIDAR